jgi:hypothetical protein
MKRQFSKYFLNWLQAEIEFLIHKNTEITPLEVKSSANFLSTKSLESFRQRYSPKVSIKLSPLNRGYNKEKKTHSIPIYLAGKLLDLNLSCDYFRKNLSK